MPRTAAIRRNMRTSRSTTASPQAPVLFRFPDLASRPTESSADTEVGDEASTGASAASVAVPTETTATEMPGSPQQTPQGSEPHAVAPQATAAAQLAHGTHAEVTSNQIAMRSWWEHWSSGIVLLLLIMALVTASVVAFSDKGSPSDNKVAEGDGATLSIPSIANLELPNASESMTMMQNNADITSQDASNSQASEKSTDETNTVRSGLDSLVPDELALETPTLSSGATAFVPSGAKAEQATVALGLPQLDTETTASSQTESRGYTLPTVQVSHPSGPSTGDSPTLYDGAMHNAPATADKGDYTFEVVKSSQPPSKPSEGQPQLLTANDSSNTGEPPTENPSNGLAANGLNTPGTPGTDRSDNSSRVPSQLASSSNNVPVNNASLSHSVDQPQAPLPASTAPQLPAPSQPQTSTVSTPAGQPTTGPAEPIRTNTPELDIESLLKEWRSYKNTPASTGTTSPNRYSQPGR